MSRGQIKQLPSCGWLQRTNPSRIIHRLLGGTGSRRVGSRPLFLLGRERSEMTMGNDSIAARVQELAERVALDHGLELVHGEFAGPEHKRIVRNFIDSPQGLTHEDAGGG